MPANTEQDEIKSLFERHGHIARFLIPKHGITALVDFIEPFEAKKAFTKLAYTQFKHVPLYLEWAPENVFLKSAEKNVEPTKRIEESEPVMAKESHNSRKDSKEEIKNDNVVKESALNDVDEAEEPENDTTLFVKNLNFRTTDAELKSVRTFH